MEPCDRDGPTAAARCHADAPVPQTLSLQRDTGAFTRSTFGSVDGLIKSTGPRPHEAWASPRPLELLDRQGEGCRRVGHAAELDREVRGGGRVGRLENHEGIRFSEETEELVDHDVVRDLRVFEQTGRILPLSREDLQLRHKEHGVTGGASWADGI